MHLAGIFLINLFDLSHKVVATKQMGKSLAPRLQIVGLTIVHGITYS